MPNLTPYNIACWMTAIALSGWLIIPRITVSIQSAAKKQRFRNFIDLFADKLQKTLIRDLASEPFGTQKHIPDLEREILEVRQYIRRRDLKQFNSTFESYKNVRFTTPGTVESNAENDRKKAELLQLLNELKRLVS